MAKKSGTTAPTNDGVLHYDAVYSGTPGGVALREALDLPNPDVDGDGFDDYYGKPIFTVDEAVAQLTRDGAIWPITGSNKITYTFADHAPGGQYNNPHEYEFLGSKIEGFSPFTEDQRDAAREAVALWDDLIAPSFVEINGMGADIVYMNTTTGPAQASAYTPFYNGGHGKYAKIQGDIYVNDAQPDNFDLQPGGYGQTTLVHETGHAIGLLHPGDYNYAVGGRITYEHDAEYFQDSAQYSIMSYFDAGWTGATGYVNWATGGYYQTPQTPMVHDIAAVQAIYGADMTTRTGDTTYGFNSTADRAVFDFTVNENPFITIWDAGGHDTLDLSGFYGNVVVDLREGEYSSGYSTPDYDALNALFFEAEDAFWDALYAGQLGSNPGFLSDNIGIAYGTVIEDGVAGDGNDTLIGNDVGNRLDGGLGGDTYTGNGGADTFVVSSAGYLETITDFESGVDQLDLSGLNTDSSHVFFSGSYVIVDLDNDGGADMIVNSGGDLIQMSDILFG